MSAGLGRGRRGRDHGDDQQQHAGDHQPAHGRRVGIDHLVVDVVRQRVGDGEQQPVSGGQRGGETAGGDQARDHIRKSRDLRGGEHDHVRVDHEVLQSDDTGMTGNRLAGRDDGIDAGRVLAADLDQPEFTPVEDPWTNGRQIPPDDVGVNFQLRERRVGRRREVQQEDEQQRPCHRLACLTHRRGGEVTHQDVRQRSRADHHAHDDREEVQRGVVDERLDMRLQAATVARPAASICCSRAVISAIACP